ncbi:hypothetical protein VTK26DRAFT_1297 [Humicola hyalothermophila]
MSSSTTILRGLLRSARRRISTPTKRSSTTTTTTTSPPPPPPSQTPTAKSPPPPPGPRPSWIGHPLRVTLNTLKFVAFVHLVWEYGVSMAPASGPSMLPTFSVWGEWLLVSKLHRHGRGVAVGDVVAYSIPINDEVGVKRVLGLEGDYVLMDAPDSGGGGGGGGPAGGGGSGAMIQVPKGHCWIVGDNLVASRDSRYFGPVPLALIRGKVIATVRPFEEFRWITNPLKRVDDASES